jgi:L-malate glycosyltransferase
MLRLAVLTPFAAPAVRGNAITVDRVVRGLRSRGAAVKVWDLSATPAATVEEEVEAEKPALIHAFHAYRVGPLAARLAHRLGVPLVLTLTGTDANHDLDDVARGPLVRQALEAAAAVTAFDDSIVRRVADALPAVRSRLVVVPQAVGFDGHAPFDLARHWPLPGERVLFVLAGGIRPVKGPRTALGGLDAAAAADPRIRLLFVGPVIDADEGEALRRELVPRPWARHIGAVPHAQIASLLALADVVLNCSLSEGGMPNSVLEALALGRAVLASDIPGNRALVEHGVTGLLFADAPALAASAARLAGDPGLRARLGAAGRALVEARYPPARELDGYSDVYRQLISVAST